MLGDPPEKQSNNEKRLEASIATFTGSETLDRVQLPAEQIEALRVRVGLGRAESPLTADINDMLSRKLSPVIWCERQYKRPNLLRPDYPFSTDFRICMATPNAAKLLSTCGEELVTDVNVEADDKYFHLINRERDYYKDFSCMFSTRTLRYGQDRIFRDADLCVAEAYFVLVSEHYFKVYRAFVIRMLEIAWDYIREHTDYDCQYLLGQYLGHELEPISSNAS